MLVDFSVSLHVSFYLGDPEGPVGLNVFYAVLPVMTVPEGAINKNQQFVFDKSDVRFARELTFIAAVTEASIPDGFFEEFLGFGVVPFDFSHVPRPLLCSIKAVFLTELGNNDFR